MKKIVLSANTSWYLFNFRQSTIRAFQNHGFRVVCLSPKDNYTHKLVDELGCQWFEIKMDNKGMNPIKDFILLFHLIRLYKKVKPIAAFNFTVKNNIYGTWACHINKIKPINNVSGMGTAFIKNNLTSKFVKLLYKLSQPFAYKVFCQNPDDYNFLIEKNLVDSKKLTLLPGSGVNINKFHPSLKIRKVPQKNFRFLFIGRMLGDKGVRELVSAAEKLNNIGYTFTLDLCGSASDKNRSALSPEELKKYSLLPFIRWTQHSDFIEKFYANADCIVLPSYREGMPRVLLEAGAMGIPSITTNVPGCRHIISHQYNGFLCEPQSIDSLCEQMQNMLEIDNETYIKMSENSRVRVEEHYDEKIVVKHSLEAVKNLLP
ncbi:glycosyltransferase family 4 protein [Providencia rettgeri]|uniref:glycosyltransferase family 4 protein n=1 Tax=Providencia rettgeri TaxID=587 RepID=UPI00352355EC